MGGDAGATSRKKVKKEAEATAVLRILIERFPNCFSWNDHRPLKIGIHKDLVARGIDRPTVRLDPLLWARRLSNRAGRGRDEDRPRRPARWHCDVPGGGVRGEELSRDARGIGEKTEGSVRASCAGTQGS